MSFKRWKMGLFVAILTGLFTGLSYFAGIDDPSWKIVLKFSLITIGGIGKDAVLWLTNHPVEQVEDDGAAQTPPQAVTQKAQ